MAVGSDSLRPLLPKGLDWSGSHAFQFLVLLLAPKAGKAEKWDMLDVDFVCDREFIILVVLRIVDFASFLPIIGLPFPSQITLSVRIVFTTTCEEPTTW